MFGGDVRGGRIMGDYPRSFSVSDPTNIGRGRLLPTTSWDALFYALTQWMGITDQDDIDVSHFSLGTFLRIYPVLISKATFLFILCNLPQYVLPNSQNFGEFIVFEFVGVSPSLSSILANNYIDILPFLS